MANVLQEMYLQEKNDLKNDFYKTMDGKIYVTVRKYFIQENVPCVTIWVGDRSVNPKYRYRFRDIASREKFIFNTVNNIIEGKNKKIKTKQEVKQQLKEYKVQTKVGDIFHTMYGYNMILNEFWEVVAIKGKKVTLKKLRKSYQDNGCYMQYMVKPILKAYTGEEVTKILQIKKYNTDSKPYEYISMEYGKRATNVTNEVLNGQTWLQDEAD